MKKKLKLSIWMGVILFASIVSISQSKTLQQNSVGLNSIIMIWNIKSNFPISCISTASITDIQCRPGCASAKAYGTCHITKSSPTPITAARPGTPANSNAPTKRSGLKTNGMAAARLDTSTSAMNPLAHIIPLGLADWLALFIAIPLVAF